MACFCTVTNLCLALTIRCQHDTARICCWAPCYIVAPLLLITPAVGWYLLPTGHSAANPPPHARTVISWCDGRMLDHYIDPAPCTILAVSITWFRKIQMVINFLIVCSHSTSTLQVPADVSHHSGSESVVVQLGDGVAVDEADRPSREHDGHSNSVRVSTFFCLIIGIVSCGSLLMCWCSINQSIKVFCIGLSNLNHCEVH